jgi:hypothetical protein
LFSAWTPASQHQLLGESLFEAIIARDLARDVADDAAEIGLQRFEGPPRPLELLGMRVALLLDQREFADPRQTLKSALHQPSVGREADRLRLHGRIDDDLGEVSSLCRTAAGRGREARAAA